LTVIDIADNLIENSQLTRASNTQALLQALKGISLPPFLFICLFHRCCFLLTHSQLLSFVSLHHHSVKGDVPVQRKSFKPKKKRDTRRIAPFTISSSSTSSVASNNPNTRETTAQEIKRVKQHSVLAKWSTSIDVSPSPSPPHEVTSTNDGSVVHVSKSTSAPSVTDKQKSSPHEFIQRRKLSAGQNKLETKSSSSLLKVPKRLFRFKLVHNLVLVDKMPLELNSLTDDDVYLLDCLHNIYVWVGSMSDPREKMKAVHFARKIQREYIDAKVIIIEGRTLHLSSIVSIHSKVSFLFVCV
jgi:hypothetical protein